MQLERALYAEINRVSIVADKLTKLKEALENRRLVVPGDIEYIKQIIKLAEAKNKNITEDHWLPAVLKIKEKE